MGRAAGPRVAASLASLQSSQPPRLCSPVASTIHVENSVYSPPSRTSVAEALADSDEDVGLALTPNSPVAAAPGRLSRSLSPGAPSTESYGSGGQQQRGSFEEAYKVVVAEHSVLSVCEAGLEDRWRSVAACVLAILLCCVVCVELPRVFDTRDPDHPSQNWFVAWVYGTLFFNAAAIGCRRAIRMYEPALPRRSAGAIAALAIYLAVRVSLLRPRYFKSGFALFFLCYGASVSSLGFSSCD